MGFLSNLAQDKVGIVFGCVMLGFVVLAVIAPWITPYDPYKTSLRETLMPPSKNHIFGTDQFGRDILSRTILATQVSLKIAGVSVVAGLSLGTFIGILAGFRGGMIETLIMRATDILLVFPPIMLAILVVAVVGPNESGVILALSSYVIPQFIRLARGLTLSTKGALYVEASRAIGAGTGRILAFHILPNIFAPLIVQGTVTLPVLVLTESALSYLGLGVQPPVPEWGQMLKQAKDWLQVAPHMLMGPSAFLFLFVLSSNMLGDTIQIFINPRLRKRRLRVV